MNTANLTQLAVAIAALITAIANAWRIQVVHRTVNSRATVQDERIEEITASATAQGATIPPRSE